MQASEAGKRLAAELRQLRGLAGISGRELAHRIEKYTGDKQVVLTDAYRAHLLESQERINKALNASVQVNEP